jgi:hypothetical protein
MKRFAPLAAFLVLLAATAGGGYFQGQLTERFGTRECARQAAAQLNIPLPEQCGSWRMTDKLTMTPDVCRILQDPAYVQRIYTHSQTGDVVTVTVIVGRPGPVSVHTPEVCYSSTDYSIAGPRRKTSIELKNGQAHDFWDLEMKPNERFTGSPLRVLYAWSTGSKWEAAEYPRFGYGGLPHLYKLQLEVTTLPGSHSKGFDPAANFLKAFLSDLQPRLVEGARRSGSSS